MSGFTDTMLSLNTSQMKNGRAEALPFLGLRFSRAPWRVTQSVPVWSASVLHSGQLVAAPCASDPHPQAHWQSVHVHGPPSQHAHDGAQAPQAHALCVAAPVVAATTPSAPVSRAPAISFIFLDMERLPAARPFIAARPRGLID